MFYSLLLSLAGATSISIFIEGKGKEAEIYIFIAHFEIGWVDRVPIQKIVPLRFLDQASVFVILNGQKIKNVLSLMKSSDHILKIIKNIINLL